VTFVNRDAPLGAGPESITTTADFEYDWLHIAPREWRGFSGLALTRAPE
jgi:hypothetical protein